MHKILFFEALGEENAHLREELTQAKTDGRLPSDLEFEIYTETLQDYLSANPDATLPDIVSIKTHSVLPENWYKTGVRKSVISRSAGYDHIENLADELNCTSLRRYCVNAVAETAAKLVLLACGNYNQYQGNMKTFERNKCRSFKECSGLKAVVFGVGKIGVRIYEILSGIGMDTYAVDVRRDELNREYDGRVRFIEKDEAYDADIIVCGMNYTKNPSSRFYNQGYFNDEFFSKCRDGLVFVNVTRGEITDETAILKNYKTGRIFGFGTDAFGYEEGITRIMRGLKKPENELENSQLELINLSLERTGNVYTQPHQAFNSDKAALDKAIETIKHLEAYYRNNEQKFDSQLPYYL